MWDLFTIFFFVLWVFRYWRQWTLTLRSSDMWGQACLRNPLPPHFSLKIELFDSTENLAPICQARRRHIPNVCNIVVAVSRNFTCIFHRVPVSRKFVPVKLFLWLSTFNMVHIHCTPVIVTCVPRFASSMEWIVYCVQCTPQIFRWRPRRRLGKTGLVEW